MRVTVALRRHKLNELHTHIYIEEKSCSVRVKIASYVRKSHRALNQDLKLANKRTRLFVGGAATGGDAGSPGGRLLTPTTRPPAHSLSRGCVRATFAAEAISHIYLQRQPPTGALSIKCIFEPLLTFCSPERRLRRSANI
jgi:hypothetical protein